ncbi:RNA polymerase sigma-70 factor [uncultured Draconibacterium sp.]|uniref:RNA polymerase sigma-70 factor n=1 Tax=uncultured Draconibacterium sp. TaxID=1573823 RepID=UPI0025CE0410|nr:RNA polymerase sigma-70 factor [uncultured Draconibacterium sp.]
MRNSDQLILNELRKKNKHVFEAIFYEYHQPLLRFAEHIVFNRDVCEDIVQSVFISLWENTDSIHIHKSLQSWLFQAVRYKGLTYLRDLNIHDKHKLIYLEYEISEMIESESSDTSELEKKISSAIENLPPEMQKIFRLKYLEGLKVKEIATEFQISENTVKTQLKRAKRNLRAQLSKVSFIYFYF